MFRAPCRMSPTDDALCQTPLRAMPHQASPTAVFPGDPISRTYRPCERRDDRYGGQSPLTETPFVTRTHVNVSFCTLHCRIVGCQQQIMADLFCNILPAAGMQPDP